MTDLRVYRTHLRPSASFLNRSKYSWASGASVVSSSHGVSSALGSRDLHVRTERQRSLVPLRSTISHEPQLPVERVHPWGYMYNNNNMYMCM